MCYEGRERLIRINVCLVVLLTVLRMLMASVVSCMAEDDLRRQRFLHMTVLRGIHVLVIVRQSRQQSFFSEDALLNKIYRLRCLRLAIPGRSSTSIAFLLLFRADSAPFFRLHLRMTVGRVLGTWCH